MIYRCNFEHVLLGFFFVFLLVSCVHLFTCVDVYRFQIFWFSILSPPSTAFWNKYHREAIIGVKAHNQEACGVAMLNHKLNHNQFPRVVIKRVLFLSVSHKSLLRSNWKAVRFQTLVYTAALSQTVTLINRPGSFLNKCDFPPTQDSGALKEQRQSLTAAVHSHPSVDVLEQPNGTVPSYGKPFESIFSSTSSRGENEQLGHSCLMITLPNAVSTYFGWQ